MPRKNIPYDIFVKAIENSAGIISIIQKKLEKEGYNVSRWTIYNRLQEFPNLKKKVEEEKEKFIDLAESKVLEAVNQGDVKTSMEVLKRLGKSRGWGDELDMKGDINANLKISIKYIDKKEKKKGKNG